MIEKRKAIRIEEEYKVTITEISKDKFPPPEKIIYGLTKDISSGGLRIQSNTFFPFNTLLKIELSLKDPPRLISAIGKVRWGKSSYTDELFEIGIEFVGISPDNTTALKGHIEKLEQANMRLKELDRLKSMFIASMSHELRTPLNSIIGLTGIILKGISGKITKVQRKELTMVKNSGIHLSALINDVIDVSKIETDQVELAIENLDLAELMQEVRDSFEVVVDEKGLKMSLKTPERLIIKSDKRRAKQVVMNLVSNAIKFTDKGEIAIKAVKKDDRVEISVADTGIGIRKENMKMLFKQFSRIHVAGMTRVEGTGLGLYLSKKIAALFGGEIEAKSEFGKGSKFTFILPLKDKEASP